MLLIDQKYEATILIHKKFAQVLGTLFSLRNSHTSTILLVNKDTKIPHIWHSM